MLAHIKTKGNKLKQIKGQHDLKKNPRIVHLGSYFHRFSQFLLVMTTMYTLSQLLRSGNMVAWQKKSETRQLDHFIWR